MGMSWNGSERHTTNNGELLSVHPDPNLNIQLHNILEILKTNAFFPGVCRDQAARFEALGLRVVRGGLFHLDIPQRSGQKTVVHSWGYDSENNILELTGTQFNSHMSDGRKFPDGVVIIPVNHPLYASYEDDLEELNERSRARK